MSQFKYILLTGGAGFIGSHTTVELLMKDYRVIIVDNLSNSKSSVIDNIKKITNQPDKIKFHQGDITDDEFLDTVFKTYSIDTVIHFAAFKAVNESIHNPLKYYDNNINGLITLLKVMKRYKVNKIVFSSSATVYGNPETLPLTENSKVSPINPYGMTKLMGEQILQDISNNKSNDPFKVIILRYFNPVGSHPSGLIGEDPNGIPNNLFPYILSVITGKKEYLSIYGDDYNTPDGTGVRDYIHVCDLARGHISAIEYLDRLTNGYKVFNLGTGKGYSVMEIVNTFNKHTNNKVKYKIQPKREGDSASVYADPKLANLEMNWKVEYGLEDMIKHSLLFIGFNYI